MDEGNDPIDVAMGCLAALVVLAIIFFAGAWAVMLLWNVVVHGAFGWVELTYWQAAALWILTGLLFGGIWRSRSSRS